jgi:mono/diheme cytochrome c family protein
VRSALIVATLGVAVVSARLVRADDGPRIFTLSPAKLIPDERHERPVLLVAVAPGARASKRFESEVLESADVRRVLERDWLCARVTAPVPDEIARTYGIGVLPTVVVLDRLGGLVQKIEGERPAEIFSVELIEALEAARAQECETRADLETRGGTLSEKLERARSLLRRGLGRRAVPALEEIAALDSENREGAGLFALAKLAQVAFRAGEIERGDSGLARVSSLAVGSTWALELSRERVRALALARRFPEARDELARLASKVSDEEREALTLEEAELLRQEGNGEAARARLEALWDASSGQAHALAEAALEADPLASSEWRTLRDGRALVARMGCAECHTIEKNVALDARASCVQCHKKVNAGFATTEDKRDALAVDPTRYSAERNIRHYLHAPDLSTVGVRFKREWVRAFLRHPVDVRPFLQESMPRLPLSDGEVELVLDYLEVVAKRAVGDLAATKIKDGEVAQGEKLFQSKGCQACHVFGNRKFEGSPAGEPWPRAVPANVRNAPNLRWVRDRFKRELLPLWIRNPRSFIADSPMPTFDLTDEEIGHLVAFLEKGDLGKPAPLAAAAPAPAPHASAPLDDVREVFLDTCKHCHLRDELGGIGNAGGGFGYAPRGLDLETISGPLRGSTGADGRRHSILKGENGEAPLVQRLLWRRDENRFDAWAPYKDPLIPVPEGRYDHPPGMPLGLPSLDDADLALLERYVKDNAPR